MIIGQGNVHPLPRSRCFSLSIARSVTYSVGVKCVEDVFGKLGRVAVGKELVVDLAKLLVGYEKSG